MKKLLLIGSFCIFLLYGLYGQSSCDEVRFTYDIAGNRELRVKQPAIGCKTGEITAVLDNPDMNGSISVLPRPASEYVKITFPDFKENQKTRLIILDETGKLVEQSDILSNPFEVDVSLFRMGIYYFRIFTDGREITKKIIIIR